MSDQHKCRWGAWHALCASSLLLTACGEDGGNSQSLKEVSAEPISVEELQAALSKSDKLDRCIQDGFNWFLHLRQFGNQWRSTTSQHVSAYDSELHSSDRDTQRAALDIIQQRQREVSDTYGSQADAFKIYTRNTCSAVKEQYEPLIERLSERPRIQQAIQACATLADQLVQMTGGDTSRTIDDVSPALRSCPMGLADAAEEEGLTLPRAFAARWASKPLSRSATNYPNGSAMAESHADPGRWLVGNWAVGDSCFTDYSIDYFQDGRWETMYDKGTWTLDDDKLTEVTTASREPPEDPWHQLARPKTQRLTIAKRGRDLIEYRDAQGKRWKAVRCNRASAS